MNKYIEKVQTWFGMRGPRERIFLFALGLVVIYMVFTILLLNPVLSGKKNFKDEINSANSSISADLQQIDLINASVKQGNVTELITEQAQLTKKLADLQKQIVQLKPVVIPLDEISTITKSILNTQQLHVTLNNLKDSPQQPWSLNITDKNDSENIATNDIYERDLQIQIQSDYFNSIEYLDHLEKISTNIYWDGLDYKVTQYPLADVEIKFHLLTNQKS